MNSIIYSHHQFVANSMTYIALKVSRFSNKKESSIVRNLENQELQKVSKTYVHILKNGTVPKSTLLTANQPY